MTTTPALLTARRRRKRGDFDPRQLARVAWPLHRSASLAALGVVGVFAVAILLEQPGAHASYARYLASGCAAHPYGTAGGLPCGAFPVPFFTAFKYFAIALRVLVVVVGVFVGAPLVSREFESGTYAFAWTQGVGRVRFVLSTLAATAAAVTVMAVVLGLAFGGWFAHYGEVMVGPVASQWQAGLYATTWWMLAVWALFALVLGVFLGAVIRRTVAAMAVTAAAVGGLVVGASVLLPRMLAIGARASSHFSPIGIGIGGVNRPPQSPGEGSPGSWLVRSWFTGPGGHLDSPKAAARVYVRMFMTIGSKSGGIIRSGSRAVPRWLSLHHDTFWVSYQPASRFWVFQGIEGAVLVAITAGLVAATVRVISGHRGVTRRKLARRARST